ncbi:MAG: ACT domain-containing protein [Ruminococcaceae bacterium]|nr:ACT domain-containing protein [Oscillospiraceae bacterium]
MNAVVSVVGRNQVGICAAVCTRMADYQINILDISQTIVRGNFTMMMVVSLEKATAPFAEISDALTELGEKMGITIHIQRQEIFDAMYTI